VRLELPFGTVTLLFTDIEGSTRLLRELGAEAYEEALAEHRRVLRAAFVRHGGVEVDTQGDAFFFAFPSAAEAVEAAREGQQALSFGPELDNQDLIARASANLGYTTLLLGDAERARPMLRDGLEAARELGQVDGLVYGFAGLAAAYAREDPMRAARLLGRADALCEERAYDLEPLEGRIRDETWAELQASLREDEYAAACAQGRALTLEDALALALRPD
jgi:class 3 adenylate cyclase